MKKNILIIISYIMILNTTFAQNNFITTINEDFRPVFTDIIQLQNNNYVVTAYQYEESCMFSLLYNINSNGVLTNRKIISKNDTSVVLRNLVEVDTNNFLAFENIFFREPFKVISMSVNKYDFNFNEIHKIKKKVTDSLHVHTDYEIRVRNNYKMFFLNSGDSEPEIVGRIEKDTLIYNESQGTYLDLLILDSNYFVTLRVTEGVYTINKQKTSNFEIEKSYNFLDLNIPVDEVYNMFIEPLGGKILLSAGKETNNNPNNYFAILDTALNIIKDTIINTVFHELPVYNRGLGSVYNNYFYFLNKDLMGNEFELTKLDTNFNVQFQKFIQFDTMLWIYKIITTNDGGALIATNTYNTYGELNVLKLYKFDQYGNLPTNLSTDIKISDFAVYPTPATDFINIKKGVQITQADFVLYNSAGQKVLQQTLNQDITTLNISNLQKGVYVYNILINGKNVDTGKTIIE